MKSRLAAVPGIVFLVCVEGWAQSSLPTIEFSGVQLSIGMSKASVVAKLAQTYHLEADGDSVVFFDEDSHNTPTDMAGQASFRNGKLAQVSKFWNSSFDPSNREQAFVEAFYNLVSSFAKAGREACFIGTEEKPEPHPQGRVAYIQCGSRSIRVVSFRANGHEIVQIVESLAAQ